MNGKVKMDAFNELPIFIPDDHIDMNSVCLTLSVASHILF